jgi:hypothetical protein
MQRTESGDDEITVLSLSHFLHATELSLGQHFCLKIVFMPPKPKLSVTASELANTTYRVYERQH